MDAKKCVVSLAVFLVLLYNIFGVDNLPSFVTSELLRHPVLRFVILVLMVCAFQLDHYLAIIIGFGFLYTVIIVNGKSKPSKNVVAFDTSPTFVDTEDVDVSQKYVEETNSEFTSNTQFKDAQSNVVNDEAMETEVRTWPEGYGTQGGFMDNES